MSSHADRLAEARRIIDQAHTHDPARLPGHFRDQLHAAYNEAQTWLARAPEAIRRLDPDAGRQWTDRLLPNYEPEAAVLMLAAVLACRPCTHLRRTPAQPSVASLPVRRMDCGRCARTVRTPPANEADRCDFCGTRGVQRFFPYIAGMGAVVVAGDACRDCADTLGNPHVAREADREAGTP